MNSQMKKEAPRNMHPANWDMIVQCLKAASFPIRFCGIPQLMIEGE
jgi:hypothetical protein